MQEWNNCYWALQGRILMLYPNKEAYLRVRIHAGAPS